ncbi:diadenylate cyclase CdaA [Youxingia wuxianensis]|uniref:Diadenylate cyclase n=1 Tax=Youxingia wuxianensis TaxID=2763678 RepID=A0A926EPH8_9FIRM|nr:diadenylate cyclase CdaA [Youxingia wuxianensis]MBC8584179.1 TIGR00159 family protein [Youxingia wuxianensis]
MFTDLKYGIDVFRTITPNDILDIVIVAFLIYQCIKLVRETRAAQLVKGILALLLVNIFATELELKTLGFLMENILQIGLFALVVVFQPELRRALEQVGRTRITDLNVFSSGLSEQQTRDRWMHTINAIVDGCSSLSRQKIGALIVVEQKTKLGDIIKTGTIIDSDASAELIGNIFFPNSPLHDGAMIIRDGRLYAAGCFLPLSDNSQISRELGTRHRAALGMSELSDAVVIVVSEETGTITLCRNGKLDRGFTAESLTKVLIGALIPDSTDPSEKKSERKVRRKGKKKA